MRTIKNIRNLEDEEAKNLFGPNYRERVPMHLLRVVVLDDGSEHVERIDNRPNGPLPLQVGEVWYEDVLLQEWEQYKTPEEIVEKFIRDCEEMSEQGIELFDWKYRVVPQKWEDLIKKCYQQIKESTLLFAGRLLAYNPEYGVGTIASLSSALGGDEKLDYEGYKEKVLNRIFEHFRKKMKEYIERRSI